MPVGVDGDCFDRYLIRIEELRESLYIIYMVTGILLENNIELNNCNFLKFKNKIKILKPNREILKQSMEGLIHHFNYSVNKIIYITKRPGLFSIPVYGYIITF